MDTPPPNLAILAAIFAGVSDATLVLDARNRVALANPAAATLFGYAPSELVGMDVDAILPGAFPTERASERDAARVDAASGGSQLHARRKDGRLVAVDVSRSPMPLAEGAHVLASVRTVAVAEPLLDACPIALLVAENEHIVYANRAALDLVGADAAGGLPSTRLLDYLHADDRAAMAAWVAGIREGAATARPPLVERVVRADGTLRAVETSSVAVPHPSRSTVLVVLHDVTERRDSAERTRAAEAAVRRQQRLADIGAVTGRMVLDIANPIAGLIMGSQRVLQMLDRLPDDVARPIVPGVDRVLATARHLETLLQEFREFVRLQKLEIGPVPLTRLLADLVKTWERDAAARSIELRVHGGDGVTVRADALKLRQALDDLVKNALDAIERGPGWVDITVVDEPSEKARIVVRDSGPGILPGVDPFALFETTKPDGTGLGLPSARQIVEAHGGTMRLLSAAGEAGAVFEVELPRMRA